jgi:hypothetical protein
MPISKQAQEFVRLALVVWQVAILFAVWISFAALNPYAPTPSWRIAYLIYTLIVWCLSHVVTEMIAAPWLKEPAR